MATPNPPGSPLLHIRLQYERVTSAPLPEGAYRLGGAAAESACTSAKLGAWLCAAGWCSRPVVLRAAVACLLGVM